MEPGFEDLKITFQPRQAGRPTGHISHTGQDLLRGSTSAADRLAGEPDANDADVVEILAFQSGLTMPLTGLGRLAEGTGVVPPVLSATHAWITRGQSHDILEGRGASFLMCAVRASHALRKRKFMLREIAHYAKGSVSSMTPKAKFWEVLGGLWEMKRRLHAGRAARCDCR